MESRTLDYIILSIKTYQEDHEHIIITDEMIQEIIEDNIKDLVKEVKENL